MRRLTLLSLLALAVALLASAAPGVAATGSGSATCLRGNWVANQAETNRVLDALIPTGGFRAEGRLYMIFRDGAFQYGSRALVIKNTIGDAELTARARFFTLAPYSATRGLLTVRAGQSHLEYGPMSGTKGGRTYTVPGPAPRTTPVPGGSTPFRCGGGTLWVKLPRFASTGWITLQRGTP